MCVSGCDSFTHLYSAKGIALFLFFFWYCVLLSFTRKCGWCENVCVYLFVCDLDIRKVSFFFSYNILVHIYET